MSLNPFSLKNWDEIDTLLLDMDGTLLDLAFDNHFWLELIPDYWAKKNSCSIGEAKSTLFPMMKEQEGKLEWYCLEYWEKRLDLPLIEIKKQVASSVAFREGTEAFLRTLHASEKTVIMLTNAHRITFDIKNRETQLSKFFDKIISSHDLGFPKEHPMFWERLLHHHHIDLQRSLFIDDSLSVLKAAQRADVGFVLAVSHPDSTQPDRNVTDFPTVNQLNELLPISGTHHV